jgi:BirA family transcriptional regulator, biotin operon repressor / biotin---[acetyl-CoA-carboxylase] ligase
MPLRQRGLPRHDARPEMTIPAAMHASRERRLHWGAQALWQQLEPLLPGLSVEVLARCASTNSELLERARIVPHAVAGLTGDAADRAQCVGRRQADSQPCLLVAEHQMAGRGRLGRSWRSVRGASLTFSLALPLAPRDWSGLSLAVGVALAQALQPDADNARWRLGLKWPNDLWRVAGPATDPADGGLASGRKLGGVLIETLAAGSRRLAVVGIGLNIAPLPEPLPPDLQDRLGCLRELDPQASAPATLARVALPLVQALKTFEREGFAAFAERYAALDLLLGEEIATTDARAPRGIARGVDAQGALRVETASGVQVIGSGEVSVRPAAASLPMHA